MIRSRAPKASMSYLLDKFGNFPDGGDLYSRNIHFATAARRHCVIEKIGPQIRAESNLLDAEAAAALFALVMEDQTLVRISEDREALQDELGILLNALRRTSWIALSQFGLLREDELLADPYDVGGPETLDALRAWGM